MPGKRYVNWQLPDPKHEPLERVREIRNEIADRLRALVDELDEAARVQQGGDDEPDVGVPSTAT